MHFVRSLMKAAALANVPKHVEHFSKFSPSPLSMKQFLDFGECQLCLQAAHQINHSQLESVASFIFEFLFIVYIYLGFSFF